jgi:pyruvate kinase
MSPLGATLANAPADIKINPRRFFKATKQIATLGPASSSFEMIEKLFLAGADVFRLNFSHGEHSEKAALVKTIREVETKYNHPIAILADLQGPKLRVGIFDNDKVTIVDGQKFTFDYKDEPGSAARVRLPHPEILNTLKAGDTILLDDGKLRMKVKETTIGTSGLENGQVVCEVINGGNLSNKKGVNTPSIMLPISPLTPKDRRWALSSCSIVIMHKQFDHAFRDLEYALTIDVDWVALSFVQKPEDIIELRSLVGKKVRIMAKLEKPSAINSLDEIVDLSDGIMVARGDLGVEMNPWDVPVIQKRIIETCKLLGKPVVVATQMLESMIDNPTPTRAEASDVATAIFDSADAVMLSAESAAGRFPVESVTMQQNIINKVEQDEAYCENLDRFAQESTIRRYKDATTTAITLAARQVADISKSKAIVAFTTGGGTALRMAKVRPKVPIIAATYRKEIARQLALAWGLYPIVLTSPSGGEFSVRDELLKVCSEVCDQGFADPKSDLLTVTCGLPFGTPGTTNVIRVSSAKGPDYWFDETGEGDVKLYGTTASPL